MTAGSVETREDQHAADAHHVGGGHEHEHTDSHDHDEEHATGHDGEPLGPIDWRAWGAAVLGIALSVLIAACFAAAAGSIG